MEELKKYMASLGFEVNVECSGAVERFPRRGRDNVAWVIAKKISAANREIIVAHFGDWSTGESHKFETVHADADPIENAEILKEIKAQEESSRQLKKEAQEAAKKRAEYIYSTAKTDNSSHLYLTTKKLAPIQLTKISPTGDLICPVTDILTGELTSLQFIKPDGTKTFLPGGRLKGSGFWWASDKWPERRPARILVAEGIATAASIHEASPDDLVVAAFYASNLFSVCDALRKKHKDITIYVCADNDAYKEKNTGLDAARAVAQRVSNCHVLYPSFTAGLYEIEQPKDWNDYHYIYGLPKLKEELMRQIAAATSPVQTEEKTLVTKKKDKHGDEKTILPLPQMVVDAIQKRFGDNLCREGKEVFMWTGTHWKELNPFDFECQVVQMAQRLCSNMANDRMLKGIHKLLLAHLPTIPKDKSFYLQDLNYSNFKDGTLFVVRNGKKFDSVFREHRKEDYITACLEMEKNTAATAEARGLLQQLFDTMFDGDPDKEAKIRVLKQIGGACLVPIFPTIAFFYGTQSKTGKSTWAKLCMQFVGKENYSSVPPERMSGFELEGMINKRVNVDTDLSGGKIDQGLFKKFYDNMPIQINRKGRQVIQAYLPALHLYCGNKLFQGIDGVSTAMDTRTVIVEFKNVIPLDKRELNFEQEILKAGPGALLECFLEGLNDLCQNGGFFSNPESGKKVLQEWKLENDDGGRFLDAIQDGMVSLNGCEIYLHCDASIRRSDLSKAYLEYCRNSMKRSVISRNQLYKIVENKGYLFKKDGDGIYIVSGIGVRGQDKSTVSAVESGKVPY